MKKILCLLIAALFAVGIFAQQANSSELQSEAIQRGIEYHNASKTESDGYAQKCIDVLKPYIKTDMTARAYYGSAITQTAGFCAKSNPIKALSLLQKGSDYIDEAVQKENSNPALHVLRLVNGISVSKFSPLKRYSVLKNDVAWFSDKQNLSELDAKNISLVYLNCGYYKIEEGDIDSALDFFEQAISTAPDTDYAKEAAEMLRRYEE